MLDDSRQDSEIPELDPNLLRTPYKLQTNWHVITGAPSCGKTTMIDLLAKEGFRTVPEVAHLYIEREMASGRDIKDILGNRVDLQGILKELQLRIEQELPSEEVIFLDRALPDCMSFDRYVGLDPNRLLSTCFHHRYASVFVLDPLPFRVDGIRDGDLAGVGYLDEWIARDYSALGYSVIRVPVLAPEDRLAFVLEKLSAQGSI